ncbi:MAG: aldo/keto reductase [Dehalococcoidia bacterium]
MEYKKLARTGIEIPEIGFGTWKFRGESTVIRRAVELGANLIDTAEIYGTEAAVGSAIQGIRDQCFIATKVSPGHFHYKDVLSAADGSLRRLGVDTIDLYQLHWPNRSVPIEETMRAMDELITAGKVRFAGVSNFSVQEMKEADRALGEGRVVSNQIKYSLFDQGFGDEVIPYCEERGITVLAYSPLEQGSFEADARKRKELGNALNRVSQETGKTAAQVLLNWTIRSPVVIAIPKTDRVPRVDENCAASGWRLTDEQYAALTQAAGAVTGRRWWT